MNLRAHATVILALIADTLRQSLASRVCWLIAAVSAICIGVSLSVDVGGASTDPPPTDEVIEYLPRDTPEQLRAKAASQGIEIVSGELGIGFGALRIPVGRNARDALAFFQLLLAGLIADSAGLLLTLVWTAAFLPAFLEPASVAVLLAKPVPRWYLLAGKYLGTVAFVAGQAVLFVGGTWVALGIRTGWWEGAYLWCIPLLIGHFAIFYSFSVLLAVCGRSTIVCVFGSVVFWLIAWGVNFGRHALFATTVNNPELANAPAFTWLLEAVYWITPKPADVGMLLFDATSAAPYFHVAEALRVVREHGGFSPTLALLSSFAASVFLLVAAAQQFEATDY